MKAVLTQIVGGEQLLGAGGEGGGSEGWEGGDGEESEGGEQQPGSGEGVSDGQQQQHGGTREVKAAVAGIDLSSWGGPLGLPQSAIKLLG